MRSDGLITAPGLELWWPCCVHVHGMFRREEEETETLPLLNMWKTNNSRGNYKHRIYGHDFHSSTSSALPEHTSHRRRLNDDLSVAVPT